MLISDCDFEEYADYEDWQELFSNVYYDCMILQIGKKEGILVEKCRSILSCTRKWFYKRNCRKRSPKTWEEHEVSVTQNVTINEKEILNTLWEEKMMKNGNAQKNKDIISILMMTQLQRLLKGLAVCAILTLVLFLLQPDFGENLMPYEVQLYLNPYYRYGVWIIFFWLGFLLYV